MGKELPQGHRLGGFIIERRLDGGGLQTAYAAKQVDSSRACRLVVFNVDPDGEPWQRFRSELGQLTALSHPIIAECLEIATSPDGLAYAAFAQPAGEDLATRLRRSGALTLRETLGLARQVAAALHAAHRSDVLHRDLRPENIYLISAEGAASKPEYESVLLYGFGVAALFDAALGGGARYGFPEYMAPEQIAGLSLDVGPASDQYALALIVYQALSASQPFRAESPGASLLKVVRSVPDPLRSLRPDLPPNVDTAVSRALAKERHGRFPDVASFVAALIGDSELPWSLLTATDSWLDKSKSTDEAVSRAMAATSTAPSLGVVAQEIGGGGVPEAVEDGATVPNTMEEVMRLARPEKPRHELTPEPRRRDMTPEIIEISMDPIEPTPPPTQAKSSGRDRASVPGNNPPMVSGETKPVLLEAAGRTDPDGKSSLPSIIVKGEPAEAASPLARLLPASLAPAAGAIERGLFLGVGLLLGYLLSTFVR